MADLTDEQCDDFRRLPGSFNDMVRAIYRAGRESTATPPADAALAGALKVVECQLGHAADVGATYVAFTRDETMQIRAALRARAVPEGFVIVPVEPTEEMFVVGGESYFDCAKRVGITGSTEKDQNAAASIYRAMLSATDSEVKK